MSAPSAPPPPIMPAEDWVRNARFVANHDGDTVTLLIDGGYDTFVQPKKGFRVLGENAPELADPGGKASRDWVAAWFAPHPGDASWPFVVQTVEDKTEKYGRWLAGIWRKRDGAYLTAATIAAGQAVPWDGKGTRPTA